MFTRFLAASLATLCLGSAIAAQQCGICNSGVVTDPASGDTGIQNSCGGLIQMRLTVVATDGKCHIVGTECVEQTGCNFDVQLDYRARSCVPNSENFGTVSNNCGVLFLYLVSYPPSNPNWSAVTQENVPVDCGDECSITFGGACTNCPNLITIGVTLLCDECQ